MLRPARRLRSTTSTDGLRLRLVDQAVLALALIVADLSVHHTGTEKVLGAFLVLVLVRAAAIDLRSRKIPNRLTLPAGIWALFLGLVLHPSGLPAQAVWGLIAGGFLFLFAVIYPKGLGMGDVKLATVMGLYLGHSVIVALLLGLLASAIAGLAVIARRGLAEGRKVGLPLAPFLAFGGAVAVLIGPQLVH